MSISLQKVTTLATCLQMSLQDGSEIDLTDHDRGLTIEGNEYKASDSFFYSNIERNSSFSIDNLAIEGAITSSCIKGDDILAGRYDNAHIEIFRVNYLDLAQNKIILQSGTISEIKMVDNKFILEVKGITKNTQKQITEIFSSSCRTQFCDHRCTLKKEKFLDYGSVTSVMIDGKKFSDISLDKPKDYYRYGTLTFISGENRDISLEVKESNAKEIELCFFAPYKIKSNDRYTILTGCDKLSSTCVNKFGNFINFQGEPHVPSIQKLFQIL